MKHEVQYMSGSGNIFGVLGFVRGLTYEQKSEAARKICSYKLEGGILPEGMLIVNISYDYDFEAEFFNPDGTSGMMCGNGGRASLVFASKVFPELLNTHERLRFVVAGVEYTGFAHENSAEIFFPPPKEVLRDVKIQTSKGKIEAAFCNVGTEHILVDFDDDNNKRAILQFFENAGEYLLNSPAFQFEAIAKELRHHKDFHPKGANASFYSKHNVPQTSNSSTCSTAFQLRTFERGVEGETGACGTAAVSLGIIAGAFNKPIGVIPPSGKMLQVGVFKDSSGYISEVSLKGEVEFLEKSEIQLFEIVS